MSRLRIWSRKTGGSAVSSLDRLNLVTYLRPISFPLLATLRHVHHQTASGQSHHVTLLRTDAGIGPVVPTALYVMRRWRRRVRLLSLVFFGGKGSLSHLILYSCSSSLSLSSLPPSSPSSSPSPSSPKITSIFFDLNGFCFSRCGCWC